MVLNQRMSKVKGQTNASSVVEICVGIENRLRRVSGCHAGDGRVQKRPNHRGPEADCRAFSTSFIAAVLDFCLELLE